MQTTSVARDAVAGVPAAPGWRPRLLLLALLLATLAAYQPAWHGGRVWDDNAHITAPAQQSWSGLYRIRSDERALGPARGK